MSPSALTSKAITVSINGGELRPCDLRVEREMINVSTLTASRPDMSWTFVDAQGHFHAYDHEGNLPTIVYRREQIEPEAEETTDEPQGNDEDTWDEYDDDDEGYTVTHIECGLCGEEIEPKRLADNPHKVIPGRTEFTLTIRGDVPPGRFSVLVDTPTQVFFGFGQSIGTTWDGTPTNEVACGPMSWRPKPQPPKREQPDVWSGLRQRTTEPADG